jgi:hypothetical protein
MSDLIMVEPPVVGREGRLLSANNVLRRQWR